jgi:hypothetical protein
MKWNNIMSKKKNYSFLKQIIITSFLSSLSIVISIIKKKQLYPFFSHLNKIFYLDLISIIPFLIMPLYTSKFFCFLGTFLTEIITFFLRNSRYTYNPFLSLTYAFCWGILPGLLLKEKTTSFTKTYLSLSFIFIIYFFSYIFLGLTWINFIIVKKNTSNKFFFNFNNVFGFYRLKPFLFIKFFFLFISAFVITYLHLKIKKTIIFLF